MKKYLLILLMCSLLVSACSNVNTIEIKNEVTGAPTNTFTLQETGVKSFTLDSATAPRPVYTQLFVNAEGQRIFSFLNKTEKTIYLYNYDNRVFLRKIDFRALLRENSLLAYHIKNLDSIYLYNPGKLELLLTNDRGQPLKKGISLIGGQDIRKSDWSSRYPQYALQTSIPFIERSGELLIPGHFPFGVKDSAISKNRFIAHYHPARDTVTYSHSYPRALYGDNYAWLPPYTEVYVEPLPPPGNQLLFSFPVSHTLFMADAGAENYRSVYGGSPHAGTIRSFPVSPGKLSRQALLRHILENDVYGPVKFDRYRNVFYRILQKGLQDDGKHVIADKAIVVIILDKDFHYLGETAIGTYKNWFLKNMFVTEEGLNIESIHSPIDEDHLVLKIFALKKIR